MLGYNYTCLGGSVQNWNISILTQTVIAKRPGPPRSAMGVFPVFQALKQHSQERSGLTETQQQLYTAEKLENFRWVSKLVATYSKYKLSEEDLVCEDLCQWLREVG